MSLTLSRCLLSVSHSFSHARCLSLISRLSHSLSVSLLSRWLVGHSLSLYSFSLTHTHMFLSQCLILVRLSHHSLPLSYTHTLDIPLLLLVLISLPPLPRHLLLSHTSALSQVTRTLSHTFSHSHVLSPPPTHPLTPLFSHARGLPHSFFQSASRSPTLSVTRIVSLFYSSVLSQSHSLSLSLVLFFSFSPPLNPFSLTCIVSLTHRPSDS